MTSADCEVFQSVENTWVNKVDYSISTPSKTVMFGTAVRVDFRLVPLLKGLTVGKASIELREEIEITPDAEFGVIACNSGLKQNRLIAKDEHDVDSESPAEVLDEEAEGHNFSRYVELPKTLNKCLQDCETKGIKVNHKLKFNIQLNNPDGHISELRANLPIILYISPALPINDNNDMVDQTPHATRQALADDDAHAAPPMYGQHTLDTLYADVDPSGYQTPGGFSTPATPYSPHQNLSSEDLSSFTSVAGTSVDTGVQILNPDVLQSRLQNLNMRGNTSATAAVVRDQHSSDNILPGTSDMGRHSSQDDESFSRHSSGDHSDGISPQNLQHGCPSGTGSNSTSRRPSTDGQTHTPHPAFGTQTPMIQTSQSDDLWRVPSYTTAVKTPAPRGQTAAELPSYFATTSVTGATEPPTAHVGDQPRPADRQQALMPDEERRLRMMRAQGR